MFQRMLSRAFEFLKKPGEFWIFDETFSLEELLKIFVALKREIFTFEEFFNESFCVEDFFSFKLLALKNFSKFFSLKEFFKKYLTLRDF